MTIIDASGILAISTRLQRLSEQLRKDSFLVYQEHGIDFQPKWFPVIYVLHKKPGLSVLEIAGEIGYTHPSTISLLKELEKEKLIRSSRDRRDERKRRLQLTEKGRRLVTAMQPVWKIIIAAANELTDTTHNLMLGIVEVEERLGEKSFLDRARAQRTAPPGRGAASKTQPRPSSKKQV